MQDRAQHEFYDSSFLFDPYEMQNFVHETHREVGELHLEDNSEEAFDFFNLTFDKSKEDSVVSAYKVEHLLTQFEERLKRKFPGKILNDSKWVWNNVGGIYARIKVLYCSTKEYVVLFGTQNPQEGFSGVYSYMNVWDIMLSGSMSSYGAASRRSFPKTYKVGDISLLRKKESRFYTMDSLTYMIDYGRGSIWRAFWPGIIAPLLFVNHDLHSTYIQIKDCARSWLQNHK